jgi:hypothetical protein
MHHGRFCRLIAFGALAGMGACREGAEMSPDVRPEQPQCPQKISLQPGEGRRLDSAGAACIQLTGGAGEYVLSYLDPYSVKNPFAYAPPIGQTFEVSLGLLTAGQATSLRARVEGQAPLASDVAFDAPRISARASSAQTAPYAVGDTLTYALYRTGQPQRFQVVAIYDDYLTFAIAQTDTGAFRAHEPRLRGAVDLYLAEAEPFLDKVFGGGRPTSNGSQFIIYLELDQGLAGVAFPDKVEMKLASGRYALAVDHYLLLAHEMTHVKQYQYSNSRPPDARTSWTQWAVEGGARFIEGEMVRRHLGLDFLGNWKDWVAPSQDNFVEAYRQVPGDLASGMIAYGYGASAAVLRDLVQRLAVRGTIGLDDAVGLVLRSALHGWFGCTTNSTCSAAGVKPQMSAALGEPFDPVSALLRVASSAAADDRSASPEFQQMSFFELATPQNGEGSPWVLPWLKSVGVAATAAGNTHQRGSLGAFRILENGGTPEAYRAVASVPLEWQLVRVR